jgi:hypothetical protein
MSNVTPIRRPDADPAAAARVTALAQRLGVKPASPTEMVIGFPGSHGEMYSIVDIMLSFLDKIEDLQETQR